MSEPLVTRARQLGTFATLLTVLLVANCGSNAPGAISWTEEVELSDGRVIVVARSAGLRADSTLGGGTEIAITSSDVRPLNPPDLFPPWSAPVLVQVLDRSNETGEWVIIGHADGCENWDAIGRPPYSTRVMYVARGGRWFMQPLTLEFIGREANMLVRVRQSQLQSDHRVPAASKPEFNRGAAPEALRMKPTPGAAAACSSYEFTR
jgi:hypothetical protein